MTGAHTATGPTRDTAGGQQVGPGWAVRDTLAMAGRNLRRLARQPEQVVFNLVSPIMFVLLFRYVFGGAIGGLQGLNYVNYLIPGIAVQTVLFSAGVTGFALADDLQKGFIYRLRSLPMARSAVFGGRVAADTLNNTAGLLVLIATGFAVGFRPASLVGLVLAALLLLLFALAVSLGYALIGMTVRSAEAVNAATFPIIFPLTFASSAFVPVQTMPSWLQGSPPTSRSAWSSTPPARSSSVTPPRPSSGRCCSADRAPGRWWCCPSGGPLGSGCCSACCAPASTAT